MRGKLSQLSVRLTQKARFSPKARIVASLPEATAAPGGLPSDAGAKP
ncbi:MAG: hypothetical protein JOZ78_09030 [Chroococcidiopsidaceae cyanobacterium CP_BM_ER_R8_30]|nr:hypothetical protein [Chroococcidiopsidaceae cyanobacterium CP_BM_ER_R8_30]